jgi:3-oxoacyl-[acyl-carrier-protein] synthase III
MSMMIHSPETVKSQVLSLLRQVQVQLGDPEAQSGGEDTPFADLLDSMAMVEFIAAVAESCGVSPQKIEDCVNHEFTTVGQLAASLHAAGLIPNGGAEHSRHLHPSPRSSKTFHPSPPHYLPGSTPATHAYITSSPAGTTWLAGTAVCMPKTVESADSVNNRLGRPPGWLERHAGICERRVWADQDPLEAVADAGRECLHRAGLRLTDVGALLVTSEAPPLLIGLAAAIHDRLKLRSSAVALEIGGACTGYLAALWVAQSLVQRVGLVLVVAVEAATEHLRVQPGASGEGAALFGDGAAAAVFAGQRTSGQAIPIMEVVLDADGSVGGVLKIERSPRGDVQIRMKRIELAGRAIDAMAQSAQEMARRHNVAVNDLAAVVAHGGNGRMPGLLARRLGVAPERVWSETARMGNLGSASIPVAWASRSLSSPGPVVWTAAGAGLTWGAAMLAPID